MIQSDTTPASDPDSAWILTKVVVCLASILVFSVIRSVRDGKMLDTRDFIDISVTVTGVVLSLSLLLRAFSTSVVSLLKEDIITLAIGAVSQALASVNDGAKKDFLFLIQAFRRKQPPAP